MHYLCTRSANPMKPYRNYPRARLAWGATLREQRDEDV